MPHKLLLLTTFLAVFSFPLSAHAGKTTVSLDADVVVPLGETDAPVVDEPAGDEYASATDPIVPESSIGYGFTLRAGYKLSFVIVDITPEVGIRSFALNETQPLTFLYGGRLAVGKLIKPGIYAHGLKQFTGPSGWEAGLTGDFTALPIVKLGVQVGYGQLDTVSMLNAGIHGTLEF